MQDIAKEFSRLGQLLDVAGLRQRVVAGNMANANTPGFKRMEVRFEDALAEAIQSGRSGAAVEAEVVEDTESPAGPDGNNVALESELVDLNKNTLLYQTLAQVATTKASLLRSAISGR